MRKKILMVMLSLPFICLANGDEHGEESHQEAVKLTAEALQQNKITLEKVGPADIYSQIDVVGKVVPNRDRVMAIYPRFSGSIKTMTKRLGESVTANEVIATVESNESLQRYEIHAPFDGVITEKRANVGEIAKDDKVLYEVADLTNIWVDLSIYRKHASQVKVGQKVLIKPEGGSGKSVIGVINYVSPIGIEDSQTLLARVELNNSTHEWLPGMYVNASILVDQKSVATAVKVNAIQKVEGKLTIFIQDGENYKPTTITIGLEDPMNAEVLTGVSAGQTYVADNSFILKADLGKGAAAHEH